MTAGTPAAHASWHLLFSLQALLAVVASAAAQSDESSTCLAGDAACSSSSSSPVAAAAADTSSLLQRSGLGTRQLAATKMGSGSSSGASWWVQLGTKDASDCGTDADIYVQLKGAGKATGWSSELSDQHKGNNFERGDVAIYTVDCKSGGGACPADDEIDEICLKLDRTIFSGSHWCPIKVRVFSKPGFTQLGHAPDFDKFTKSTEICKSLSPAGSLPQANGKLVSHVAFWADFGLSETNRDAIVDQWPLNEALSTSVGGFALYDAFQDFVAIQGHAPQAVFQLGDVGYVGGTPDRQAKVVSGITASSVGKIQADMQFPALGNHDVNAPSGCSNLDLGQCYYGIRATAGQSEKQTGFEFPQWNQSWFDTYPGLAGGKVVIPKSSGAIQWAAPFRYNVNMGSESRVYYIVGLAAGAYRTAWGPGQPDVAKPVSNSLMKGELDDDAPGNTIECDFLRDSIAEGKSLGKTVFVYLTHDGPHPVTKLFSKCDDVYKQLDVWLFGHEHWIDLSVPSFSIVTKESSQGQAPVRFLLGNGGFDEGQSEAVNFVAMQEYHDGGRVKLYFQAYDACIGATNCAWGSMIPLVQLASCWRSCLAIEGGHNNRKALPSKEGFAFVYDAPLS